MLQKNGKFWATGDRIYGLWNWVYCSDVYGKISADPLIILSIVLTLHTVRELLSKQQVISLVFFMLISEKYWPKQIELKPV